MEVFPMNVSGDYLHSYIQARAKREGVDYDLSSDFFRSMLEGGITLFFGVAVDERGFPVSDEQEPEPGFLQSWKATLN